MAGRGAYQKKNQNIENVRARRDFLTNGIKTPINVDKAAHTSLVSQRSFAALKLTEKIKPIALNTLKSLANELFTEPDSNGNTGFAYLDALRVRLSEKLSKVATTRTVEEKATREANKIDDLMARITATESQSIKREKAYLSLYSAINGLIKNGDLHPDAQERLYRILENHHATFANLFEPKIGSATNIDTKVTKLRDRNE